MTPSVINNSEGISYAKPEEGDVPLEIGSNKSLYADIDGLATIKYKNAVFKVVTGTNNIVVDSDGSVNAAKHRIAVDGWIVKDGYYYKNGGLVSQPLNKGDWDKLYKAASKIGKKNL